LLKKRLTYFISIYFFFSFNALSDQKINIISEINNLNSLEFEFQQKINDKLEKGDCLLEFPGKLKCNYYDNKQKTLIINNKKLVIFQKRYDKTYFYPISKSPFLNILYKENLIRLIKSGKLESTKDNFQLIYNIEDEITVLFDKNNFELSGWKIIDQYNNEIIFNLKIKAKNVIFSKNTFKLPTNN